MKNLLALILLMTASLTFASPNCKPGCKPGCSPEGQALRTAAPCDSNGDGQVTKAEMLATAEEHFNKMDRNGDGILTSEERLEVHHDMLQGQMALLTGMRLAKAADADGSGEITRDEWDNMVANLETAENGNLILPMGGPEGPQAHHRKAPEGHGTMFDVDKNGTVDAADLGMIFEKVDTNGDGILVKEEMAAAHANHPPMPGGPHPPMGNLHEHMKMLDANGDGAIQLEDLTSWFQKLDSNGNGTLEQEELAGLHRR